MNGFRLHRLGQLLEPEPGNPLDAEVSSKRFCRSYNLWFAWSFPHPSWAGLEVPPK